MSIAKQNLKVNPRTNLEMSYHRLAQYATYPNRQKHYKPEETFKEILKRLQIH
jgi:hypothetical protein